MEALFRMDSHGRLLESNEAFPQPAPRLFVGRTAAGALCRARHDVPAALVTRLRAVVAKLPPLPETTGVAEVYDRLTALLAQDAPVARREVGISYEFVEPPLPPHPEVVELGYDDRARRLSLRQYGEWLELS